MFSYMFCKPCKTSLAKVGFSSSSFLGLVLDVGLVSKPGLPSATPTRGHSRGRLQDRIFKFSQGRPPHLLSSLLNGCSQKTKVHQARATILKSRLDFAPVCRYRDFEAKSARTFHAARTTPPHPTRPPSLGSLEGRLRRSLSLSR